MSGPETTCVYSRESNTSSTQNFKRISLINRSDCRKKNGDWSTRKLDFMRMQQEGRTSLLLSLSQGRTYSFPSAVRPMLLLLPSFNSLPRAHRVIDSLIGMKSYARFC